MDVFDVAFETVFNSMMALNQVIVMITGLVFAMIGGALIYDHHSWKQKSRRIRAMIVGLREGRDSDGSVIYFPVAEYTARDGTLVRAECNGGSSAYIDKTPGSRVDIYVHPDKPGEFRLPGRLFFFVGLFVLWVGLGACAFAVLAFEATPYTPVVVVLFLLWGALKFKKHVKPRDQWDTRAQFAERMKAKVVEKRESMPILDAKAVKTQQEKNIRNFMRWGWVGLLIGAGLCWGAHVTAAGLMDMLDNGLRTQGRVVGFHETYDSDDGYMYFPEVEFSDGAGTAREFRDNVGSSSPSHSIGEEVTVLYMEDGRRSPMIDRGMWNWLLPGLLGGFGVLVLYFFGSNYIRLSRAGQRR